MKYNLCAFRFGKLFMVCAILCGALTALSDTAAGFDVRCIDGSKYKYLYQIFGSDPGKFLAYLDVRREADRLPDAEFCRAVMLSGPVREAGDQGKLLQSVIANRGWLAAVYLDSPGGNAAVGGPVAMTIRNFRLKTYVANNDTNYSPDFGLRPLDRARAIRASAGSGARCWLKKAVPELKSAEGTVSGIVHPGALAHSYEENTDSGGQTLRSFALPGPYPRQCQDECSQELRCQAWTYVPSERSPNRLPTCWLKAEISSFKKAEKMVSGAVLRQENSGQTYQENLDLPGQDYKTIDLPSPDPRLCQQSCKAEAQCQAWTFTKPLNPAALMSNWSGFSMQPISAGGCASACTGLFAAGVDRHGIMHVHRGFAGDYSDVYKATSGLLAGERPSQAFFDYMDVGADVVPSQYASPFARARPVKIIRFPRYFADYLINKCKADPEKLELVERRLEEAMRDGTRPGITLSLTFEHVREGLARLHARREQVEQCAARELERERLAAFDRMCGKGCDAGQLIASFDAELKQITDAK